MTGGLGITGVVREGSISAALDHPGGVKYLRPGCSHGGQILPAPTDLALMKACKERVATLGKQVVKAEVVKVLGHEKAGVVMQRCGVKELIIHQVKGIDYSR